MALPNLVFSSKNEHRAWLAEQAILPRGFRVGTCRFSFVPREAPKPSSMNLTLVALDEPTPCFGALFTRNAFPGAPVILGRSRMNQATLGGILVNNKVSNVCAPRGIETAEALSARTAELFGWSADQILPSSTGVIGWRLPVEEMMLALPKAHASLQAESALAAAEAIVTTDLYPKVRRARIGRANLVGIAKGAGMIEPNLATMLVFLLTDAQIPREVLRAQLKLSVEKTFNCISIDSDTSTSDSVVALSSCKEPCDPDAFQSALDEVCLGLAQDVVRNGEGVHHVLRVTVTGAPSLELARSVGKSVVNSPLFQCAVNGNDANVGRLLCAVGKELGKQREPLDLSRCTLRLGNDTIFREGQFHLDPAKEISLARHLREGEMYASVVPEDGINFRPPIDYPPHERCVEILVDLGLGDHRVVVWGNDRSHEYISENADYRS